MRTSERASWSATVLPEGMVPKSRPHIDLAKISVGEEHNFPNILYFNVKRCFLILKKSAQERVEITYHWHGMEKASIIH